MLKYLFTLMFLLTLTSGVHAEKSLILLAPDKAVQPAKLLNGFLFRYATEHKNKYQLKQEAEVADPYAEQDSLLLRLTGFTEQNHEAILTAELLDTKTFKVEVLIVHTPKVSSQYATIQSLVEKLWLKIDPPTEQRYVKLDSKGYFLPDNASNWVCVLDKEMGLIWEVKTDDGGLHDKDWTYTWYKPILSLCMHFSKHCSSGKENGGKCRHSQCDTKGYIEVINRKGLCGHNNWKLPTLEEIQKSSRKIPLEWRFKLYSESEFYFRAWNASRNIYELLGEQVKQVKKVEYRPDRASSAQKAVELFEGTTATIRLVAKKK